MSSASNTQSHQPEATTAPSPKSTFSAHISHARQKVTTREGWFGGYDYTWLCLPTIPFTKLSEKRPPPFYALDADMPLTLAIASGLQHALAMLAGMSPSLSAKQYSQASRVNHATNHLCECAELGFGDLFLHDICFFDWVRLVEPIISFSWAAADSVCRYTEFGTNVAYQALRRSLPWYWLDQW